MATHPIIEPVVSLPPVLAFALGVPAAPRSAVEAVIEAMLTALDQIDGDPDVEDDTEDCGHDEGEPDYRRRRRHRRGAAGAGCPISDPGGCEHDGRELEAGQ